MTHEPFSRRRLLATLPAFLTAHTVAFADFQRGLRLRRKRVAAAPVPSFVYFGTDTYRGVSKGVYMARFDPASGRLTQLELAAAMIRPSFLAVGTVRGGGRRILYAAAEGKDEASSAILSFGIDAKTGALTQLNQVSSGGQGPAYLSLDGSGEAAFVANYGGGTVSSFHILPDGRLSEPVERIDFHDAARFGTVGPNTGRQDGPHPHSAVVSPDSRFLLVNDLGKDAIEVFPIESAEAKLRMMEPHRFGNNRPGSGPRHAAFHPNGRWVYSLNELDCSVDRFLWQTTHRAGESQALLVATPTVAKLLDPGYSGKNTSAELAISSEGFFLYASNRGEDSLVVFAIDQASGDLKLVQRIGCGGKTPRHFTLAPTGNWLLCGNQDSASVTVFARDGATGRLTGPVQTLGIDSPQFTLFV